MALAGFEPSEVQVTVTPRELMVEASHKASTSGSNGEGKGEVRWSELHDANTYRRVEFDQDIAVDKTTATLRNGLLKVVMPKSTTKTGKTKVAVAT